MIDSKFVPLAEGAPRQADPEYGAHVMKTAFRRPDQVDNPLWVITTLFNSVRFRSRWKLTEDFLRMIEGTHKARLVLVEVAFNERPWVFAQAGNPYHLRLRTSHEIWHKESAINLGARLLPPEATYIAWVDADTHFARYDWADETIQQLQHFPIVQMWSEMHDLNAHHELIGSNGSFGNYWVRNGVVPPGRAQYPYYYPGRRGYPGAPGLAWATWRQVWNGMGGLLDTCILGAGDWYMAHALTGQVERVIRSEYHPRYAAGMREWQRRAATTQWAGPDGNHERTIMGHVGVVPGLALHYFHGPKSRRFYATRDQVLVSHQFNPDTDLKRDIQGLYQLSDGKPGLRRDCARYFSSRDEDATA